LAGCSYRRCRDEHTAPHPDREPLMYDVAALAIFAACFLFVFILIEVFDRV
jgi:hypothetical protein